VDWLESLDELQDGDVVDPKVVAEFLKTIDCHLMGSRA